MVKYHMLSVLAMPRCAHDGTETPQGAHEFEDPTNSPGEGGKAPDQEVIALAQLQGQVVPQAFGGEGLYTIMV